ncbi:PIG-L family deacetylase [Rhodococcus ruber]|uniref:1D-myo-inositol 2-acetamido-2-deoxy-alpha-D-glucopyranoside deacetylase n=1 Tax=Rhodococcus ruber TaxID=1830 RepID=A0A098BGI0_9NOCA|nr:MULTISPECIES: PIG-L family deacetylase [Rhodococcus]MCD2126656.1 PIG-L family deacetylase [Rhodococcus ruber]MCZ4502872.1 PIG-L family deacetylase [Rhodococcus ruber]MCZ4530842.1 PIG-L family deacetylase [Rhodococcus ruber]MCZ4620794.1 PIG-L family deacetylase [Rhodococcus ruber]MDI9971548.1 PIG-L family deacetylase [Rhodococcus ruber]
MQYVSVLVCFHAHPDDEVFTTGGVMRLAADAGHRVVLVVATDGAAGEVPDGLLGPGESLAQRRRAELEASAETLGVARLVPLGYADSGMAGTPRNSDPAAFCNVDVEAAAARFAAVLEEESADVVTIYDPNGGYGHPDHVQVHRVGARAQELTAHPSVYEAAMNRDHIRRLLAAAPEVSPDATPPDLDTFGLPETEITTTIDVSATIPAKRAAMLAHASQVGDFGPMLAMTPEQLASAFGLEWFRRRGAEPALREHALPL